MNRREAKFVKKYMSLAKYIAETNDVCYSRQIGVVIVDSNFNKVISIGYNGPPRKIHHCDSPEHLQKIFLPQIDQHDKFLLTNMMKTRVFDEDKFIKTYSNCKICPRKLLNCKSGERLNLCTCVHAETNAIVNAGCNLEGTFMFAWCPLPCIECTKLIINSGIKRVYCYKEDKDYSFGSRYLFDECCVKIIETEKNEVKST